MNTVLQWKAPTTVPESGMFLGPASVLDKVGTKLLLDVDGAEVCAVPALASPYQCEIGDRVLVAGQGGDWYVIGVIQGQGKTRFTAAGDLEFRAPQGRIEFVAERGIQLRGPTVQLVARKIETAARALVERFDSVHRWVRDSIQLRAGRIHTNVESTYRMKAGRIVERAKGDVRLDGRKIHLG
jgi:hypothetical protein